MNGNGARNSELKEWLLRDRKKRLAAPHPNIIAHLDNSRAPLMRSWSVPKIFT
jgi:hypothetical protein